MKPEEIQYPRWIPNPNPNDKRRPELLVHTHKEHITANNHDYQAMLAYEIPTPETMEGLIKKAVAEERARCAAIAQKYPKAGSIGPEIAKAIRGTTHAPEPVAQEAELVTAPF